MKKFSSAKNKNFLRIKVRFFILASIAGNKLIKQVNNTTYQNLKTTNYRKRNTHTSPKRASTDTIILMFLHLTMEPNQQSPSKSRNLIKNHPTPSMTSSTLKTLQNNQT